MRNQTNFAYHVYIVPKTQDLSAPLAEWRGKLFIADCSSGTVGEFVARSVQSRLDELEDHESEFSHTSPNDMRKIPKRNRRPHHKDWYSWKNLMAIGIWVQRSTEISPEGGGVKHVPFLPALVNA